MEQRWNILPIKEHGVWEQVTNAKGAFWIEGEIDEELSKDKVHWDKLDPAVKKFLTHILAFFASADGIVGDIIVEKITSRVQIREVKVWYNYTAMMEDIHNVVYGKLIMEYEPNAEAQESIFNSVHNFPAIRKKVNWASKWVGSPKRVPEALQEDVSKLVYMMKDILFAIGPERTERATPDCLKNLDAALIAKEVPLAQIIIANAIMEGIFFSGSFCAIFWINHIDGGKLPGLIKANEFISRDEGSHYKMAIYLYNKYYSGHLPDEQIYEMVNEAVMIEKEFIDNAMGLGSETALSTLGMNSQLMLQYIKYVADQFLINLKLAKLYNVENPFSFMDKQSISQRISDFFIFNPSEYKNYTTGRSMQENKICLDDDF